MNFKVAHPTNWQKKFIVQLFCVKTYICTKFCVFFLIRPIDRKPKISVFIAFSPTIKLRKRSSNPIFFGMIRDGINLSKDTIMAILIFVALCMSDSETPISSLVLSE